MLSSFSSCGSRRPTVGWNRMICLVAVCCCGIASSEERSDTPTIEPERSTIKLEAAVDEACVGGRGRFLIVRLRGRREIVVLDLLRRFVSFTVPLGEDDVEFAAGSTQLHVVAPESSLLQSWNLHSGARLRETAWPLSGHVKTIAMGSGNDRLLAVCFAESPHRAEPSQWATIEIPSLKVNHLTMTGDPPVTDYHLRSSVGGELIVAWTPQAESRNRGVVLLKRSNAEWLKWPELPNLIMPNETGTHLFTDVGVFTSALKADPDTGLEGPARCISAVTGAMYLAQGFRDDADTWRLRSLGSGSPLATIRIASDFNGAAVTTLLKRGQPLVFSVEAGCIATLSGSPEVVLYDFDANSALASSTAARGHE